MQTLLLHPVPNHDHLSTGDVVDAEADVGLNWQRVTDGRRGIEGIGVILPESEAGFRRGAVAGFHAGGAHELVDRHLVSRQVQAGDLGSPPDVESNISPLETGSEGVVVVDGSIPYPGIGLLASPVVLFVEDGKITRFDGDRAVVERLESLFRGIGSTKAYVLAECGVGLVLTGKLQRALQRLLLDIADKPEARLVNQQLLRSLKQASFDLDSKPATVTVAAAYSKRRREDTLPLRPDMVDQLVHSPG